MSEQILEMSVSARIHFEFPQWFKYQVCIVPLIIQICFHET